MASIRLREMAVAISQRVQSYLFPLTFLAVAAYGLTFHS